MVFHGNGGYDFGTIYTMPIWLRKFTFKEIQDHFDKEKKAYENAKKGKNTTNLVEPGGKINTPEFLAQSKKYKGKTNYK